jgi:exosortase/archaeosortase family protein
VEISAEPDEPTALALARRLGPRFALTYAAIAAALFGIYAFPFELLGARGDWLTGYLVAYAHLAGALLRCFEPGVVVEGTIVYGRFVLQIVRNCDAADVNILFTSAVLAFPGPFLRKLAPLLLGLAALIAANVLRICSLYYVGVHRPGWFHTAHEEVWPLVLVAFTLLTFLACVRHLAAPPRLAP